LRKNNLNTPVMLRHKEPQNNNLKSTGCFCAAPNNGESAYKQKRYGETGEDGVHSENTFQRAMQCRW